MDYLEGKKKKSVNCKWSSRWRETKQGTVMSDIRRGNFVNIYVGTLTKTKIVFGNVKSVV